jgi:tRNA(fMet)-specific endonuclease VapC
MAMKRVLLDTSAYIFFTKAHAAIQSHLEACSEIGMSPIVLGELHAGMRNLGHAVRQEEKLRSFLALPEVRICEIDEETAVRYAEIQTYLRRNGTPIGSNDVWIAATAMQHGLGVVTTDNDFNRMPQVLVEFFPPAV